MLSHRRREPDALQSASGDARPVTCRLMDTGPMPMPEKAPGTEEEASESQWSV